MAHEELYSKRIFKLPHLLAKGRLRNVQPFRRACDVADVGNHGEIAQLLDVDSSALGEAVLCRSIGQWQSDVYRNAIEIRQLFNSILGKQNAEKNAGANLSGIVTRSVQIPAPRSNIK